MKNSRHYHLNPPSLAALYGKAIMPGFSRKPANPVAGDIPSLDASLTGARTGTPDLHLYRRICGFPTSSQCPITWPHILVFPLHMRLLTDDAFPLPLLGLLHLRNSITQHRAISQGECLDLTCHLDNATDTDRGIEFDAITQAHVGNQLVWEEVSTFLFRKPSPKTDRSGSQPAAPELLSGQATIKAPEDIGRRYAQVSGDRNPIHLHALSAKAFGFPRAIAHGMWSKARCIALIEEYEGALGAARVEAQFKKPLLLPGSALLTWDRNKADQRFRLLKGDASAPHIEGSLTRL